VVVAIILLHQHIGFHKLDRQDQLGTIPSKKVGGSNNAPRDFLE